MNVLLRVATILMLLGLWAPAWAQAQADAERMRWWREARFGMFIHWGLYAIPAGQWEGEEQPGIGEWIMQRADIPVGDYEALAPRFQPNEYDPEAWALAAKAAGMKYVVITAKHHDGFCLFDTDATDWDVVDATPHGRDLLAPLAEACREHGLKFCTYYSIMDWHHPAQQRSEKGYNPTLMREGRKAEYVAYMKQQLKELLDSCDPEVLWFDGEWVGWWTEEDGRDLVAYLRGLKPTLIINNRVGKGRKGMSGMNKGDREYSGDFGTPEQEIPATGFPGVDWESCMTMNDTWGYKKNDQNWKSTRELLHNTIDIVSKGGNYLLNVGPMANGEIPAASLQRMAEIGAWMGVNGEAIYGASASPFEQPVWGRYTSKPHPGGRVLYAHVLEWPEGRAITIPWRSSDRATCTLLATGDTLAPEQLEGAIRIALPEEPLDPYATVVKIKALGRAPEADE